MLPLPISAPRSASSVLDNPANIRRAVALTRERLRFSFANAISDTFNLSGTGVRGRVPTAGPRRAGHER
jgi:hypothetical protein